VDEKMLRGVISMPSNIFATTGTNVSILFIDKTNKEDVVLIDASSLGKKVKEGKNQKTLLSEQEEIKIIDTFNYKKAVNDFSIVVSYKDIQAKKYSFSAGQYFELKIDHIEITKKEFDKKISESIDKLTELFEDSKKSNDDTLTSLKKINYEQ
jgi:type I restriction enzyme M protein